MSTERIPDEQFESAVLLMLADGFTTRAVMQWQDATGSWKAQIRIERGRLADANDARMCALRIGELIGAFMDGLQYSQHVTVVKEPGIGWIAKDRIAELERIDP